MQNQFQLSRRTLIKHMMFLGVGVTLSACNQVSQLVASPTPTPTPQQQIVGKWERVTARGISSPFIALMPDQVEFQANSKMIVPNLINGTYTFDGNNRVKLEGLPGLGVQATVSFTPSGTSMVLEMNGDKVEYRRK